VPQQLGQHLARVQVLHDRALRHLHLERLAAPAVEVFPLAVHAAVRTPVRVVAKGDERRNVVIGDEPHVAASAPVTAVRATVDDRAFPPERDTPRTAVAAARVELALVDELGHGGRAYRRLTRPLPMSARTVTPLR